MSEFMGMIQGKYDAKEGFMAGGASLHLCMSAHGPDAATFEKASNDELKPVYFDQGLAFMFETSHVLKLSSYALNTPFLEKTYTKCWATLPKKFDPAHI